MLSIVKDDLYGFIDIYGEIAIEPKYSLVDNFVGDLARVWSDSEKQIQRATFIDVNGNIVYEPT